jgi:hypothetical protein
MMDIGKWLEAYRESIVESTSCYFHGLEERSEFYLMRGFMLKDEIISHVTELEAKLADYENHLDELEQEKGA